jgi:hypothetical protein
MGLAAACIPQSGAFSGLSESPEVAEPAKSNMEIEAAILPNLGPAPELQTEIWLNTDRPLRLAELRGQVVLLDMWTFG